MSERALDERLVSLQEQGHTIYSISRIDTFNGCLYEAYLTYVMHEKGKQNIYGALGGRTHDVLESIINDEATAADLLPALNNELEDLDLFGIDFPKDSRGGDTIRQSWIANMTHFCNNYVDPGEHDKYETEQLFIYQTPKGRYLQGYIDLMKHNEDGSVSIYDYKTSSMYSGEELKKHGRQLITYLLAKEQEGYNVKSVHWIFLKYVTVSFMAKRTARCKEKTLQQKIVERRKIGNELAKYVEQDLYEAGIDEVEADIILNDFKTSNDFNCLPEVVRKNYTMSDCYYEYEVTPEVKQECIDYLDGSIDMWEALNKDDVSDFPHMPFMKTQKNGKVVPDYFYCSQLCAYRNSCMYLKDFLATLDAQTSNEDEDLF